MCIKPASHVGRDLNSAFFALAYHTIFHITTQVQYPT